MIRRIPFETWLIVIVFAANVYALFVPANSLMNWFRSDDAFYYFKTAQNISEGYGITFDRLGRDSGFHPLWMAICVPVFALARFNLILPLRAIVLISSLLSVGTAVLIYRIGKRYLHPGAAIVAALFFAFFPTIHAEVVEMGMESGISAFFIALLLYRVIQAGDGSAISPRWMLMTGFIAALTVLARLDNIFLVCMLGIWLVIHPNRFRYLLVTDIALIVTGVLWSYFLRTGFGPQSAQYTPSSYWMAAVTLGLRVPLYYLFGLYSRPQTGKIGLGRMLFKSAAASVLASALIGAVMIAFFALNFFPGFPRLTLIYEAAFGLGSVLVVRSLSWWTARTSAAPNTVENDRLHWPSMLLKACCFFIPIGAILVLYMGWNFWYFGTPSPVSGQIKRWWGTLPNVIYGQPSKTAGEFFGLIKKTNPWNVARNLMGWPAALPETIRLVLYGALTAVLVFWQRRRVLSSILALSLFPVLAGCFIQIISYTGTGYLHVRGWYWVGQMILVTLGLAVLLDSLICGLPTFRKAPDILTACLSILILLTGMSHIVKNLPAVVTAENAEMYLAGVRELEINTEPGTLIGSTGGGVIAYFVHDRTIVNLDGLMNTYEYFQMLQAGTASQYLDRIGLAYIYSSEYPITSSDPYFQFKGRLNKVKSFAGSSLFLWK